jgi:hypothetical protein
MGGACRWLFFRFQEAHPTVIIGKKMFDSLRPFFVIRLKERNMYCCIYHVKMEELQIGFNHMRLRSGLHSRSCNCSCEVCRPDGDGDCNCTMPCLTYAETTESQEAILCPREEFSEWHARACLFGECD